MLEKTLERPLDIKEIQLVHPKGNESWIFIGRTNAETETPKLRSLDSKNWLIWKVPDAGKDWRQDEKGMTENEMVRWYHQLGHEFEEAPGVGDGQGSLTCFSPWGHKESDTTEQLNWTELREGNMGLKPFTSLTSGIKRTFSLVVDPLTSLDGFVVEKKHSWLTVEWARVFPWTPRFQ